MNNNFLLKKKKTLYLIHLILNFEKKQPSMQPCAFIIPYSNMKLQKTLIFLSYLNILDVILKKMRLPHMVVSVWFTMHKKKVIKISPKPKKKLIKNVLLVGMLGETIKKS
jgi:hypothetical protein